jgi:hypothetical protein
MALTIICAVPLLALFVAPLEPPHVVVQPATSAPVAHPADAEAKEQPAERDEGEAEREPANEIALVLAGTYERKEDATSFTIGAEYERRLSRRFGIVGELEYVSGPGSWVFAMPLVIRPVGGGFKVFAGPGLERRALHEGHKEHEGARTSGETGHEGLFLWRVGTGYTWEFDERYAVGPSFYLDFVREAPGEWGRAFVFGVSVGLAF